MGADPMSCLNLGPRQGRRAVGALWLWSALLAPWLFECVSAAQETAEPTAGGAERAAAATPGTAATSPAARRSLLDSIRDDLVALRFEKALAAISALLAEPGMGTAEQAEAWILRAQAHVALGDLDAAETDYREILRLRPGYQPEASLITPKAMKRFEKVRKATVGTLLLSVDPADALVEVDGRPMALGPDGALPLTAGVHTLVLSREGFDRLERDVSVDADRIEPIQFQLMPNARSVLVSTQLEGVEVWLDGVRIGETAVPPDAGALPVPQLLLPALPLGEHSYEFRKDCFRSHTVREILNVDLLDRSPRRMDTVALKRTRSTLEVQGGPEGAEVSIDGEVVGKLPIEPVETCPATRRVEISLSGRPIWRSDEQFIDASIVTVNVQARPNMALVGVEEFPPALRVLSQTFNVLPSIAAADDSIDYSSVEGWKRLGLPRYVDLGFAVVPPSRPGAAERWFLYSPILNLVEPIERLVVPVGRPEWSAPLWGFEAVDHPEGGVVVATVVEGGPAHLAGLRSGDRLSAVGGGAVGDSVALRSFLFSAGEALDLQWTDPQGETRSARLTSRRTPILIDRVDNRAAAAFRAAWALVSSYDSADAPVGLSNLALLFSQYGLPEVAVDTWRRVAWPDRSGVGAGTVQYYLGRDLETLGREADAAKAYTRAAGSEATAFRDDGPPIAPAARDRLADLGVPYEPADAAP